MHPKQISREIISSIGDITMILGLVNCKLRALAGLHYMVKYMSFASYSFDFYIVQLRGSYAAFI
jgi:hypothetical protein